MTRVRSHLAFLIVSATAILICCPAVVRAQRQTPKVAPAAAPGGSKGSGLIDS
jgi:hypothetical protein